MSRLSDLGLRVGTLSTGSGNAITDVAGVSVGHFDIERSGLATGLTAVLPYSANVVRRRLFVGRWSLDGGDGMTGLGVAEDLGTFSSPILLVPAAAAGTLYQGLIQLGLKRDSGLSTVAGWPPVVVPVDDSMLNPALKVREYVGEAGLYRALESATTGSIKEGSAGVGCGLMGFGVKGGIGTASRLTNKAGAERTVGFLVAVNGGSPGRLAIDGFPIGRWVKTPTSSNRRSLAAVIATDAPLIPRQLDRLAGRCSIGLSRVGLLDATTSEGLVLAFSTAAPEPTNSTTPDAEEQISMVGEAGLPALFQAAIEAAEEAVLNALLAAEPTRIGGHSIPALGLDWVEQAVAHQGGSGNRKPIPEKTTRP